MMSHIFNSDNANITMFLPLIPVLIILFIIHKWENNKHKKKLQHIHKQLQNNTKILFCNNTFVGIVEMLEKEYVTVKCGDNRWVIKINSINEIID